MILVKAMHWNSVVLIVRFLRSQGRTGNRRNSRNQRKTGRKFGMTYYFVSHLVRFANILCQAPNGLQGASVLENQTECNNVVVRSKHSFSFTLEFGTPENDKRWHTARHTLVLRLLRALPVHALIDGENLWTKLEKDTSMRIVRYLFL